MTQSICCCFIGFQVNISFSTVFFFKESGFQSSYPVCVVDHQRLSSLSSLERNLRISTSLKIAYVPFIYQLIQMIKVCDDHSLSSFDLHLKWNHSFWVSDKLWHCEIFLTYFWSFFYASISFLIWCELQISGKLLIVQYQQCTATLFYFILFYFNNSGHFLSVENQL